MALDGTPCVFPKRSQSGGPWLHTQKGFVPLCCICPGRRGRVLEKQATPFAHDLLEKGRVPSVMTSQTAAPLSPVNGVLRHRNALLSSAVSSLLDSAQCCGPVPCPRGSKSLGAWSICFLGLFPSLSFSLPRRPWLPLLFYEVC